jgi:hypothetical protein
MAALALAVGLMLSGVATYRAVPGDALYPLKRAAESTLVRLSTDDLERGERELASAQARAAEVAALLSTSSGASQAGSGASEEAGRLVAETLKDMERSTRSGINRIERVRPRSPKIRRFARDQRDVVVAMLDQLDEVQQDQANVYLDYIEGLDSLPE